MVTRTQIVEAAREFVGLPYHPQFPSRGLLLAVAARLGLPQDTSSLRGKFKSEHGIKPGDVIVLRVSEGTAQHAIVTEHKGDLYVVRPDLTQRKFVEHILDQKMWMNRILQVFEPKGLSDEPTGKQ